jgi:hypothetical protein
MLSIDDGPNVELEPDYDEIADLRVVLFVHRFRRFRGDEFLETRIVPKRIEHWIEPEQRRSERHAHAISPMTLASIRCI